MGARMQTSSVVAKLLTLPALVTLGALVGACSAAPGETSATSEGEEALTSNERAAYTFFVGKGLTHAQSAGIVGNLIQESNVLPGSVQAGGPGRGIAQWSVGGRWNADHNDNLEWYASTHGLSAGSLTTQLDFIWYELETFSAYGLSKLRASTNVTAATIVFETDFEGCGQCDQTTRIHYAEQVLSAYGGGGAGGGGGGGAASCYSSTLGRTMPANACVESRSNRLWYQCDNGTWVDRWNDPTACNGVYPL
jgi:hypothetical protein